MVMLKGWEERKLSQREPVERTEITQADISRMETETGEANLILGTLKRIAEGLGMSLNLSFTPLVGAEPLTGKGRRD